MSTPEYGDAVGATAPPLLSYVIGRADRAVRLRLARALEPHGLTLSEFTTLSVLDRRPGLSNAQLARRALIVPQSMLEVLSALEQRGLVLREPTPGGGRALPARLTDTGRDLVQSAEESVRAVEAELGDSDEVARVAAILWVWSQRLADSDA